MFSRREFSKLALAAIPASAAFARRVNSKVHGVQIGAQSYSFRDRSLDECLKGMQEVGLGECELFEGHVGPPDASREEMQLLQRAIYPLTRALAARLAQRRRHRRRGNLDFRQTVRHSMSYGGVPVEPKFKRPRPSKPEIMVVADISGSVASFARFTLQFVDRVDREAKQYKIRVGFHGHSNTKDPNEFSTAESFEKAMAGRSPYINVNLDIGHFTAAGGDPVAFIRKHHARIVTLHIKDRKKDDGPNMPFGQGDTPIKEVLQLLEKNKYKIPANIEYEYKGSDTIAEVKKCFDYCKQALA